MAAERVEGPTPSHVFDLGEERIFEVYASDAVLKGLSPKGGLTPWDERKRMPLSAKQRDGETTGIELTPEDPIEARAQSLFSDWQSNVEASLQNPEVAGLVGKIDKRVGRVKAGTASRKEKARVARAYQGFRDRELSALASGYPAFDKLQAAFRGIGEELVKNPDPLSKILGNLAEQASRRTPDGKLAADFRTGLLGSLQQSAADYSRTLIEDQSQHLKNAHSMVVGLLSRKHLTARAEQTFTVYEMYRQGLNREGVFDIFREYARQEAGFAENLQKLSDEERIELERTQKVSGATARKIVGAAAAIIIAWLLNRIRGNGHRAIESGNSHVRALPSARSRHK